MAVQSFCVVVKLYHIVTYNEIMWLSCHLFTSCSVILVRHVWAEEVKVYRIHYTMCVCVPTWELWEEGWLRLCPQVWVPLLGASWPADQAWTRWSELDSLWGRLLWLGWGGEAFEGGRETVWAASQTLTKREQTEILIVIITELSLQWDATGHQDIANRLSISMVIE